MTPTDNPTPAATAGSCHPLSFRSGAKSVVAVAVRTLNLTVADALYAYAVTGSAFATVMVLAAPHLEVFVRCIFHGKG